MDSALTNLAPASAVVAAWLLCAVGGACAGAANVTAPAGQSPSREPPSAQSHAPSAQHEATVTTPGPAVAPAVADIPRASSQPKEGPDPGGPAECWAPRNRGPQELATTTATQVALLLPDSSPLLHAEQEKLRELVHRTLAKRFGLPMFPLARTRELEQQHEQGLMPATPGACIGPSLKRTFARAAPDVGFAPIHIQCHRGGCSFSVALLDKRPKKAGWPTSFASDMKSLEAGLAPFARLAAALRPNEGSGMVGIYKPKPKTSAQRLEVFALQLGEWDNTASNTMARGEAALASCAQPGRALKTWAVLDVAHDGTVAALERADARGTSAAEASAWQCVQRTLTALRFPAAHAARRALLWISPKVSDAVYRDDKYGGLDERARVRVRLPPVEEPFEIPADSQPVDELQTAFAVCYREVFGAAETRVAAVRTKVSVPMQGNARYTFDVQSAPDPAAAKTLAQCLEAKTRDLSWQCGERNEETRLEGLACMFGERAE